MLCNINSMAGAARLGSIEISVYEIKKLTKLSLSLSRPDMHIIYHIRMPYLVEALHQIATPEICTYVPSSMLKSKYSHLLLIGRNQVTIEPLQKISYHKLVH